MQDPVPCVREGVVVPENMNMVLHYLSQGLGWGQAMKNISIQHYMNRYKGTKFKSLVMITYMKTNTMGQPVNCF